MPVSYRQLAKEFLNVVGWHLEDYSKEVPEFAKLAEVDPDRLLKAVHQLIGKEKQRKTGGKHVR